MPESLRPGTKAANDAGCTCVRQGWEWVGPCKLHHPPKKKVYPQYTEEEMIQHGLCVHHDMPVDRNGKCEECYYQDEAYAEYLRDGKWLWDHR